VWGMGRGFLDGLVALRSAQLGGMGFVASTEVKCLCTEV
jgi:hypothetical protein